MKLKHLIGIAGLTGFLVSWIAVAVGFAIHVNKNTWVILVVVAAFATEALIWCIAAMHGLGILEARKKIWRWLKKPFTKMHRVNVADQ